MILVVVCWSATVFYISLNKEYFGKAIFSRLFSARYHILKKKTKKKRYWAYVDVVLIITLSILATCLVSYNCSVTHVRWREGTSSVLFQWRPAFSALWRCGNSVVSVHHINNFWNTRSNLTKFSGQSPQWLRMVCAKLHVKRLRIDWDINEKRSADVVTTLAQCFALITFEVLNQTPPNLLGSCRSSSRWYLQNYIKNGWELTSELTSKWIYILKYSSKFHTNLINNFFCINIFCNRNKYKNVIPRFLLLHGYWWPVMSVSWQSIRRILVQSFCSTADREIQPNEFISGTQGKD